MIWSALLLSVQKKLIKKKNKLHWAPCNNNGLCKYGQCFCYPGWKGVDCSQKDTCPHNCSGKGICDHGKCVCNNGSKNADCSETKSDIAHTMRFREVEIDSKPDEITSQGGDYISKYDLTTRLIYSGILLVTLVVIVSVTLYINKKALFNQ